MSIKAVFTAEGGSLNEIEEAKKILEINKEYEVQDAYIESWNADVVLKEHPKHKFNVCLFDVDFDALMRRFFVSFRSW